MRRRAHTDRNQPAIVAALRGIGATVQPLHAVGQGCPDLLVGYRGVPLPGLPAPPGGVPAGPCPPYRARLTEAGCKRNRAQVRAAQKGQTALNDLFGKTKDGRKSPSKDSVLLQLQDCLTCPGVVALSKEAS